MCLKNIPHIVQKNVAPAHQLSGRTKESWLMVGPMNFRETLTAIYALLAPVPSH
jgi:hypothetical protein